MQLEFVSGTGKTAVVSGYDELDSRLYEHGSEKKKKVLDAAIRSEVSVGEETILLVLLRDQGVKGLKFILEAETDYGILVEDVRQSPRPFKLYYPVDELGNLLPAEVEIVIDAPGFKPPYQSKAITVLPEVEEEELVPEEFILTPIIAGELHIFVKIYQQPESHRIKVGSKPISTVCLESRSRNPVWTVHSTTDYSTIELNLEYVEAFTAAKIGGALNPEVDGVIEVIASYEQALMEPYRAENIKIIHGNLGNAYMALGYLRDEDYIVNTRMGINHYEQALRYALELDILSKENIVTLLVNLSMAYIRLGEVDMAIDYYEKYLPFIRNIDDKHGQGTVLRNLGMCYVTLGQVEKARGYLQESVAIFEEIKDPRAEQAKLLLEKLDQA